MKSAILASLLGCIKGASGDWQHQAANQAAARWDVPLAQVEIIVHERPQVSGLTVFAAINPDGRGSFKRYAPGIRRADGSLEWDGDVARGEALAAVGISGNALLAAEVAALMIPNLAELPKLITDPERGAYYQNHYGISGVAPPSVVAVDDRPGVDFWIKGDPVTHVVAILQDDGRATLEL